MKVKLYDIIKALDQTQNEEVKNVFIFLLNIDL